MPENYAPDGLIQSPAINPQGKPTQKSIKDKMMAADVVKSLISASKDRQIVASRITAKINAERPYIQSKLEHEGVGWRQNFTTRPLVSLSEKVWPRFYEAVNSLKYFTDSKVPEKFENATEKTEKARDIITRTIRNKKGWKSFLENVCYDNSLFGHTVAACLDEDSVLPKHFRFDQFFLADGTKQSVIYTQVALLKEIFLPHELFALIEDKEVAKDTGWDVEETIKQINKACPANIRENLGTGTTDIWYQNAHRELTLGASYMAGASVINVYSLLVREVNGKMSHYRLAGDELALIYAKDERFENAESCLAYFSFEKGNDTMAGSKGLGRQIYELAGMMDRTRNEVVDRAIMSGKMIVRGDVKQLHTLRMHVIGMMAVMPLHFDISEHKIDGNIEPFLKLDAYFSQIAEQLVGAVSLPKIEGEAYRSPQAWAILAQREEENRDTRISRFLEQFTDLVALMQRRICDPSTEDEDAKEAQRQLKEFLTPEEIKAFKESPVASTIRDLTPLQRQLIVQIATEKRGHPLYNQRQLEVEDLTNRVGADFANRVLLPVNDPTEQAEQQRAQQLELSLLLQSQPVPVSPRDNHLIHLNILKPVAEQTAMAIMQGQVDTNVLEALLTHITEHYNAAQGAGTQAEELKEYAALIKNASKALNELKQLDEQAGQLQQVSQAHDADDIRASAEEAAIINSV